MAKTVMAGIAALDRSGLTTRDMCILNAVILNPGSSGADITDILKLQSRSCVQTNIPKMIRKGLMEDRRVREGQAIPARLFATDAGIEFWQEIVA